MKNYNRRYEIEFFNVNELSDLHKNHFIIYNPEHEKCNDWFYEYMCLEDYLEQGGNVNELEEAINAGYVRVVAEVEPWD